MLVSHFRLPLKKNPCFPINKLFIAFACTFNFYNCHAEENENKELLNSNLSAKDMRRVRLDSAQAYVSTNQFPLAINEYEKILADNPQDCQVRQELVDLYINFARYDAKKFDHTSARNWYLNAMTLDPTKRVSLLREYTDELSKGGNGPEAINLYREILISGILSPADTRLANLGLAQTYIWVNNHEEALKIYDLLLKINPHDQEARKGKVQVYGNYARFDSGQGRRQQAIEWFRKAIEVDPSERYTFIKELADQLRYTSQLDEAIALYKEILNGKPGGNYEREIRLILAQVYANKFQYDEALKEYDYLLQQNKYDAVAKQGKAKVYLDYAKYNVKEGKHKEAIEWYYKVIGNDPIIRPEILINIEDERAILGDKDTTPISDEELNYKACSINAEAKIENIAPILSVSQPPSKEQDENIQKIEVPASFVPVEPQKSEPTKIETQEKEPALELHNEITPSTEPKVEENYLKECAKKAFEDAQKFAKYLRVFEANRAFEASLKWDSENINYRENYAWHLHTFLFLPEALTQFEILLPYESEKTPYYEVLGWDNRRVGRLNQSICAFSNIYNFRQFPALSDTFTIINKLYRNVYLAKINALWNSMACADEIEAFEIKKKLFDYYYYIGDMKNAESLALTILMKDQAEYLVHYRYASLLYEKKKYAEAVIQFQLLLEKLPCNAFLYMSLGQVYEDMGCTTFAKMAYQTAVTLDKNPKTERAYARILSKLGDCCEAIALSDQIVVEKPSLLTKTLSASEVSLNCGNEEYAANVYRSILEEYPYNQEALWGLLKSSTYTRNSNDALLSYRRWPTIWFDKPIQNLLVNYYRPPEITLPFEFFHDSTTFRRASLGLDYDFYLLRDIRFCAGAYYTQFGQNHFDTIDRMSAYICSNALLNKYWEFNWTLIENCYKNLQYDSKNASSLKQKLYSKAVTNCRFHLIYHCLPEFSADINYGYYDVVDTVPPFNNPIYNYSNQIGAASLNIRTSDWGLLLNYTRDKVYCFANFIYGRYSDGNTRITDSFRAGYRFWDVPDTHIYYSYFYLNFKKPSILFSQNGFTENAYYDPKNLEIHSIGCETKYDITRRLQVRGELALLYLPKCRNFAYSGYGYFNYQFTDRWSSGLALRYYYENQGISRTGLTGYYHAESVNFQIQYAY